MNDDFKILIIASHSGKGFVHIDKLLPGLVKLGYNITFYGWDRNKEFPKCFHKNGIEYKMIFTGWGFTNNWLVLALPLYFIKAFLELSKLRKGQFQAIMAIDFDSALPQSLASIFNKIPFIYNVRDNFSMRTTLPKSLKPIITRLDKIIMHKAKNIIVPDENRITSFNDNEKEKIHVIYNGAIEVFPLNQVSHNLPFTIYAMGYLMKTRGISLLLEAGNCLPDIRVLLAGVAHEIDLIARIKELPNIDYRGWLQPEDALRLCFESDIIFTFYDPISEINRKAASNKWFDAMMSRKPILVNEEVERSSWIIAHDIGYCCPYGNVEKLVQTIQHVRSNPKEAEQKGINGRKLYEKGYSWESSLEQIDKVIKNVILNL